ncbi:MULTISPECIES: hypothetical protein [unclassified Streptomyces]|uniref:hypothetical protein n=1 Tax=unclassified Streptomyces TaxID=2593676 RepID=UPI00115FFE2F|nr:MULTISPECIES: hypothetical protein [unclassified Streptomyces]
MIRRVGFFAEVNEDGDPAVYSESLTQAMDGPPAPDEDRILSYLKGGEEIFSTMGAEGDVISEGEWVGGAGSLVTDGEWVWPVDLVHYLSRYHIALPIDFLDHVRKVEYPAPVVPDERAREIMVELFPKRLSPWS